MNNSNDFIPTTQNQPAAALQNNTSASPQKPAAATLQNNTAATLQNNTVAAPQCKTNDFVDAVVSDLVPYLDAFDPVESLLVLNELFRRLGDLEEEYQAYANWEADSLAA